MHEASTRIPPGGWEDDNSSSEDSPRSFTPDRKAVSNETHHAGESKNKHKENRPAEKSQARPSRTRKPEQATQGTSEAIRTEMRHWRKRGRKGSKATATWHGFGPPENQRDHAAPTHGVLVAVTAASTGRGYRAPTDSHVAGSVLVRDIKPYQSVSPPVPAG